MKSNPYYCPKRFGLELVYLAKYKEEALEFDYRAIWKNVHNDLYTFRSYGFLIEESPFESINDLADLEEVDQYVKNKLIEEAYQFNDLNILKTIENV